MSLRPPPPPGQTKGATPPSDEATPTWKAPEVRCPLCSRPASLAAGTSVYPMRPELQQAMYWICWGCDAWVPCIPGTDTPHGTIANHATRMLRSAVHEALEPLWRAKMERDGCEKHVARSAAYEWLAGLLSIPIEQCHVRFFDEATCRRVLEIIARIPRKAPANEAPVHE